MWHFAIDSREGGGGSFMMLEKTLPRTATQWPVTLLPTAVARCSAAAYSGFTSMKSSWKNSANRVVNWRQSKQGLGLGNGLRIRV